MTSTAAAILAATLLSAAKDGVEVEIKGDSAVIDPGRSVMLELTVRAPASRPVEPPDLRSRVRGFSLAEDYEEEPETRPDGTAVRTVRWKLVPEPCAGVYKIAPFSVGGMVAGPLYFDPPPARPAVEGPLEIDPRKDFPPLSWRLAGRVAAVLLAIAGAAAALFWAARRIARRVRERRMSPIERAWAELERLVARGLPGRGRYKDFYVELTMVVRRYVQRKYGVRAPHLTTEEFFSELGGCARARLLAESVELREFLSSADMVKFAGVEATPEMADGATEAARGCLRADAARGSAGGEVSP